MKNHFEEKSIQERSEIERLLDLNQLADKINSKVVPVFRSLNIPLKKENVLKYCFVGGKELLFRTDPRAKIVIENFPDFPNFRESDKNRELINELFFDEKKNRFIIKNNIYREACVQSPGINR